MKKNLLCIFLAAMMLFSLASCTKTQISSEHLQDYVFTLQYHDNFNILQLTDIHWNVNTSAKSSMTYLDKLLKEEVDLFDCRENIKFEYRGLEGAMVSGPKPQLTRVFTNLLGNAVQAIESSQEEAAEGGGEPFLGRILVSLRRSGKEGFYDIVFEDNGPGVSDENRSKLFTPNFTTKNNGTGLGLAICRTIVEKCNGEISYSKSFSLKGACFTVRFPRMD